MTKTCRDCGEEKPLTQFTPANGSYTSRCLPCRAVYMSEYRRSHIEHIVSHNREYRLTSLAGWIMKAYRSMRWIVVRQKSTRGLPVLPKREFYAWALQQKHLPAMLERYRQSGFKMEVAPCVSRIDRRKGYIKCNLHVTTLQENRRRTRRGNPPKFPPN